MGGKIEAPSITHAAALLIIHGRVTIESDIGARIKFSGGMGAVFSPNEPYTLHYASALLAAALGWAQAHSGTRSGSIKFIVVVADLRRHTG